MNHTAHSIKEITPSTLVIDIGGDKGQPLGDNGAIRLAGCLPAKLAELRLKSTPWGFLTPLDNRISSTGAIALSQKLPQTLVALDLGCTNNNKRNY